MTRQQEFRKQTEEAKFEAFSLMCEKVAELENKIADIKANCDLAIEGRDIKIKDLEWQLQEVVKDNDIYQAENKTITRQEIGK